MRCGAIKPPQVVEHWSGHQVEMTVSLRARRQTHGLGHFLSLKHQEDRAANDRFQGTADVAHRLRKVKSTKRSLKDL